MVKIDVTDLQFDRIITAIKRAFQNYDIKPKHAYNDSHPVHGQALTSFGILQLKGCNKWSRLLKYSKLNHNNIKKRERKWENRLGIRNYSINWKNVYKLNERINSVIPCVFSISS